MGMFSLIIATVINVFLKSTGLDLALPIPGMPISATVILTGRADNVRRQPASCAALYAHTKRVAAAGIGNPSGG
jgi:FtsH-binding integral membrane protein